MSLEKSREAIQLLNTAILKNKERKIDRSYEKRLNEACQGPEMDAFAVAVAYLSDKQKISRDQAAMNLVETVIKLDAVWNDYVRLEGIQRLKETLFQEQQPVRPVIHKESSFSQQNPIQVQHGHF